MTNTIFKRFLLPALILVIVTSFFAPNFAEAAITGNNSPNTASSMGYWKYSRPDTTILPEGENEAYYQFTINKGERVYVRSSYNKQYTGMKIEVYNSKNSRTGSEVINPDSITPFIFANTGEVTSTSETYFVKVTRGTYTGNMYFTVSIQDRIKSGNGTFNFTGTATNLGNSSLNFLGVDSSVITMDLTNNSTVPKRAVVKSITTTSTQTPNQGNVTHKLMASESNIWYTSLVSSATSGSYRISLEDELKVAQKWSFKYNAKATARSTMSNVKADIRYEYDVTDGF
ncbi:hypothetical protein [Bacillus safensis]|uniref:hypothetical protein n=1 Tax=Bacillus safensis TaxID=561879 RepID=UPI00227EE53C|nr:hypothetical protein [Bacillus safensis]MCY7481165.1 hypothetical protein [Bacillus safensis]MCY7514441.1 hypothetical protein [Bacillus safensis]MCY7544207.1 hypothetical protein [Bacillus safensis]MCY7551155.1 hypothetical protein [Bacillus safensis]MCY7643859.1 hypothetical protein [Bacillus safensis]